MRFLDWLLPPMPELPAPDSSQTFAVDMDPTVRAAFGLPVGGEPNAAQRVTRKSAMQVPAVKRARDIICSWAVLPIRVYNESGREVPSELCTSPSWKLPRSIVFSDLIDDLLMEGLAWWKVEAIDQYGYPTQVSRLVPAKVEVRDDARPCGAKSCTGKMWYESKHLHDEQVRKFTSPSDGILIAGARAIRTCLALDSAAARNATGVPPVDILKVDASFGPTQRDEIAQDWRDARAVSGTAILPAGVEYAGAGWNPEQLEMAEAREHAVLEIARLTGVDPEELGVSTTSRTYANIYDRKRARLDETFAPLILAVEERMSMPDITPPGYTARVDLSALLRTSDIER
ncbi:MAG: phage portal protein, partial [Phycicoccus sp.]